MNLINENPHRIGMTPAERARHVPGVGAFDGRKVGSGTGKFFYRWIRRDTGRPD